VTTSREQREPGWGAALALAGVVGCVLLALAGRTTLWDRDEPRFAQATVEMVASGDYLVPTFNGRLRPDKPILIYWLMSLPVRLLGPTALAARLWSPVAMAAAALLIFAVGRTLLPSRAGLWAMAVMAATPLAVVEGQAATADAVLLAAIAAAMACFAAALAHAGPPRGEGGDRVWPWLGLGLALGLALLAKGPVGLAVPGLSIGVTLWLLRRRRPGTAPGKAALAEPGGANGEAAAAEAAPAATGAAAAAAATEAPELPLGRLAGRAALAALLGVGLFCAWAVPANLATGGELARLGLGRHVVGRALGAMEGHGGGWLAGLPYYFVAVWVGFAPWVLFLPGAVSAVLGGRLGGERGRALLVGWAAPAFLLMTAVATKLPHYILPIWPALAVAVGGTLEAERRGELAARDRLWLRRGAWLLAPLLGLALAAALLAAAWAARGGRLPPAAARGLLAPLLALAAVLAAAGGWALREHLAGRYRRAAAVLLGGALAAAAVAGGAAAPAVERLKPAPRLAAALRAAVPPAVPVATFEYAEPSFTFYLRRWPVRELADDAAAAAWAAERSPGVLVLPRPACRRLGWCGAPGAAGLAEIAAAGGLNVAKGTPLDLVAVRRPPP
jgi:4-amino-4-deoxy-L-arabinose transferase-like glycosyltransferase